MVTINSTKYIEKIQLFLSNKNNEFVNIDNVFAYESETNTFNNDGTFSGSKIH